MKPKEMMQALNQVVEQGKARFVGCCNYPAWLLAHSNAIADRNGWARLVSHQVAYNIMERGVEVEILPQAVAENVAISAYRPLAMGLLTGKYRNGAAIPADSRGATSSPIVAWMAQHGESVDRFIAFAEKRGVHPAQLATAWVRYSEAVTSPIVGVSSLSQLETAIGAFEFDLSAEEYAEITYMFDTNVKEESYQRWPGFTYNFPRLRRNLHLLGE